MLPLRAKVNQGVMATKVLYISQSYSITEASPSDCLVSYPEHSFGERGLTPLLRCCQYILQPQMTGPD